MAKGSSQCCCAGSIASGMGAQYCPSFVAYRPEIAFDYVQTLSIIKVEIVFSEI